MKLFSVPSEWDHFLKTTPITIEVVDGLIWDTEPYNGGETIIFFRHLKGRRSESNMWFPGMLPNPQSLLIERINIRGLTRRIAKGGTLMLVIGNKIYFEAPLENYIRHEKFIVLDSPLMIAPQQHFYIEFKWTEKREAIKTRPKMRVSFRGKLARAVQ